MLVRPCGTSSFEIAGLFLVRVSTKNGNTCTLDLARYSEM